MLAGRNYNYKGPRTHYAIVKKILVESGRKRRTMSIYKIEKIVRLFFNLRYGLASYFRKGNNFFVRNVGEFIPIPSRRYHFIMKKRKAGMIKRKNTEERWKKYWARWRARKEAETNNT